MGRRRGVRWTRGVAVVVLAVGCVLGAGRPSSAHGFDRSVVVRGSGNPTLLVDGRPFFFYGAAFFYERIPAARWRASMLALRAMGFNTLDLYVPWNWHEITAGAFDFDGHTNPRRNLREVLALARETGFKLIVRPGPVIRNEWRNGGYPAWLLRRPEYGMPLHDVLEGRYPATATLQNANSDDAAAQWLHNATHLRYASRWLRAALREFVPFADRVVAVQLDDDQGAYIDNQTWPAPHFRAYLATLAGVVRGVTGPRLPLFINTYEMKVTASAPVWAMGNWYQSDAYSIGEHDRAALEFSAGLLQTQPRFPVAMSEFQAGWLAQPEDPAPRAADPTNTTLALHTLLGLGMRGVVDFPAQDTIDPAGWEAPFANMAYLWDAALRVDLTHSARYAPTKRFGDIVRTEGSLLAGARRYADGAIAYLTSAYDAWHMTNSDVFAIVARTQAAQQACRARHLTCDLVDLRYADDAALRRYRWLIVPNAIVRPMTASARRRLARYRAAGGRVLDGPPDVVAPHAGGIPDATVLLGPGGAAFLDIVNYDERQRAIPAAPLLLPGGRVWTVGPLTVPAREAVLLRFAAPRARQRLGAGVTRNVAPHTATAECDRLPAGAPISTPRSFDDDSAEDGYSRLTLTNDLVAITLAPNAGARAFTFAPISAHGCVLDNAFTSVGALRDDVALQPPLSVTDRIGKYTRSFPAGMFNRPYRIVSRAMTATTASATLEYAAPDVVPNGARFTRTLSIVKGESAVTVTANVSFSAGPNAAAQRAVRYDSVNTRGATIIDERARGAVGFFFPASGRVAIVAWRPAQVEAAQFLAERTSTVLRLQFAPGRTVTRYAIERAVNVDAARNDMAQERDALTPTAYH